jgi:hypothetical protein
LSPQVQISEPSLSEIREELRNVLSSNRFRQSPRLAKLLRYICTSTLTADSDPITEYTIAVDVLGKTQDFKEGKDSIVRVEVHRLRKRLSEYYEAEGSSNRIRIVIPTGKYIPEFRVHEPGAPIENGVYVEPSSELAPALEKPRSVPYPWVLAAVIGLLTIAIAGAALTRALHRPAPSAVDAFWSPVLSSGNQILLCIGNVSGGHTHPTSDGDGIGPMTLKEFHSAQSQMVHVADASALAAFTGLLQARGRHYRIVSQSEATYSDLQNSPVVLIGLLNNEWTQRLVGQLRFSVERPGHGLVLIRDRDHPSRTDWSIDFYKPFLEISRDYAIVLRAADPRTEQMVLAAAGMSVFGTMAAAEFLTNENEMRKLTALAPKGWEHRNVEIVLATDVIRGHAGPPTVVATHFW